MSFLNVRTAHYVGRGVVMAAGAYAAYDVSKFLLQPSIQRGGMSTGTLTGRILGTRHVIAFSASQLAHPRRLLAANDAMVAAEALEQTIFHPGSKRLADDDGGDAFRHTFASTQLTYRLEHDLGMSKDAAAAFVRSAGTAHEDDSLLTGTHYENARAMDLYNNDVGIELGSAQAAASAAAGGAPVDDARIAREVLAAISSGRTVVLDKLTGAPRNSTGLDVSQANTSSIS